MTHRGYVITVAGEMDQRLREEFEDHGITCEHGLTILRVASPETPVLHGVLHRIAMFDLEILGVHPAEDDTCP